MCETCSSVGEASGQALSGGEEGDELVDTVLVNEFVEIRVAVVDTRCGRALEIHSGRTGATTLLDPFALDLLAGLTPAEFAALVRTRYGG